MDMVDILIHVHPDLSDKARSEMEDDVRACSGVVSAHFSHDHAHLLTVEYDPEKTSSEALLKKVGERGTEVSRIGL